MKNYLRHSIIFIAFVSCAFLTVNAQVVGFVSSPRNPATDSLVSHTTLFPRITTAQRDTIAQPATNFVVFNTDNNEYEYNGGTAGKPDWKAASPDFEERLAPTAALLPRMTTEQRNSISNPPAGLTIFNTNSGKYNYNNGTPAKPNWKEINK